MRQMSFHEPRVSFDDARDAVFEIDEDRTNDRLLRALASATDAALERLTKPQRETVIMRYFEGLSQREIARRRGVSPSAVSRMLRRSIERLRSLIIVK